MTFAVPFGPSSLRRIATKSPLLLLVMLSGAAPIAGCGSSKNAANAAGDVDAGDQDSGPPPATFRAVFITDTHIIGPQYTCCHENGDNDNISIEKTVARLTAVKDSINAITPAPAMVFVSGDVVHAAHVSRDPAYYRTTPSAYSIAAGIFKQFAMPVYMVMGNHDYEVDCGSSATYDRQFSEDRFKEFLGTPPYQSVDYGGWKFMLINSQRGTTFDVDGGHCDTETASVGAEQMTWAKAQLDEGKPTLVMSHYMRLLYGDVEEGDYKSLPALLDAHTNVKAFFAGHSHRWLDMTRFNNGVMHRVLGGTRYDANNFWLVQFDSAGGFKILDEDKQIVGSSCASTWSYDGDPQPVAGAVDQGDCVSGI